MRSKLCAGSIALLLVVVALFFIFPGTPALAGSIGAMSSALAAPTATPTADTTAAVNAANNAVSHAQDLLNIMGWFATILGVVLTLFTVFTVVIGILGFKSYSDYNALVKDLSTKLTQTKTEADNTRSALVYLSLGDQLLSRKDTEEAMKNYKEAGRLLAGDAQVQYILGRIYSGAGDYEAAINTLETAIKMLEDVHPPDAVNLGHAEKELGLAYRRRGNALDREAEYDAAIQHLKKATTWNPGDSDTLAILGGLYRRKGEYKKAYSYYEQARHLNPASSYALGNLASLAWHEGNLEDARRYFNSAEMVALDHIKKGQGEIYWDYYDLGLAQLAQGNFPEAQKSYATAIKETPGRVQFESVLDNLNLLRKASQPITGLDDIVKMINDAAQ
ncbi:MAG TPA: tetratricopeptide repeat protein [Ktedonobacteraceae bacterium]|nr:tetratricopeptide repeat protein [Ktedonobacteraceae bacterium]